MNNTNQKIFDDIVYAQCWEDPGIDREAFHTGPDDTVFSITSGGCNTLAFLLDNPRGVYALDLNPHQNRVLELKMAAIASLPYGDMLEFMGVRESGRRCALYARMREALGDESRAYWDARQVKVARGIIHTGRYEAYMRMLRRVLECVKGKRLIRELFDAGGAVERSSLYREYWDTLPWRAFTRLFLSRAVMSSLFTKEFFSYVDGSFSFGRHFAGRIERALTVMPLRESYFASYMLLGRYFDEEHLPPYLLRENFPIIRSRLSRVHVVTGSCGEFFSTLPESSIQKFNFTNIFEWMSDGAFEGILRDAWRVASDGAVMTYRNLLVHRERPPALASMIRPDRDAARALHARDRSFIYRNYVVERITKKETRWAARSKRSVTAGR